ncbi:Poly [ADP-ribose] polymerase 2 [Phlyctochytrium planicorne]|nr:Poly [ADP-ribose] polymerase 2 [Phlyctochytrium planicorne]
MVRAARGEKTTIFEGLVFTLTPGVENGLARTISDNGGSIVQSVTKKLTHVVATAAENASDKPPAKLRNAKERSDVQIVSQRFIKESISKGKVLDPKDFPFDTLEDGEPEEKTKGKRKKAADDEEAEDDDEPKPKAKSAKKAKKADKDEDEEGEDGMEEDAAPKKATRAKAKAPAKKGKKAAPADDEDEEMDEAEEEKPKETKIVKVVKKGKAPVDPEFPDAQNYSVYEQGSDIYDAMLNQTDIQKNSNKFYVIQVLQDDSTGKFVVWNRWGRVGEKGQSKRFDQSSVGSAIAEFKQKFKDKTKNHWDDRENFEKIPGKYYLLERSWDDDDGEDQAMDVDKEEEKEEVKPKATKAGKKGKKADAEQDEKPKEVKIVKQVKKGKAPVDEQFYDAHNYSVYQTADCVYDAMLNQTDIKNNNNKFYVIQVLQHDSTKKFVVWNRWGRVGEKGQSKSTDHSSPETAIRDFESKFKDKTKNRWDDRANFEKVAGKYYLLERSWGDDDEEPAEEDTKKEDAKNDEAKVPESTLDAPVQDLIKLIFDLKKMEQEMTEIGYNAKELPLGKLTKNHIKKGYSELKALADELSKPKPNSDTIMHHTNLFYSIIPHDFGRQKPIVLDSMEKVKKKIEMVEALADIEVTTTLLKTAQKSDVNPIDSKYESLKCNMKVLDKTSDKFKLVEEYTRNTHGSTHSGYALDVQEVFEIDKEDIYDELGYKLHNKKLLWHGSRLTNFVGILSQGLRIAPPEAPVTGYMFGKGVYFADMVSKSANYCQTSKANNTGLMLLCEVALGDENPLINADFNAGDVAKKNNKHSTLGKGRTIPDPAGYKTLDDGVVVPCGKEAANPDTKCYLQYNEFIVYDIRQIRLRYLIKMKFNYKY